ncbi:hypothetical protein F8154_12920 [Alkaliphilus pronyensis]|uniref:Uncharacterized protein n=1 Tax=Alkaliphilus pronyensis TaxID=1482732 RepID=A0A6I0F856_9FIRM|nr:hypothetical protein [Alkaliphilus pronyensis]KAB3531317.1 hypothetical protein F8154_12920 [Alkaliphilus pronyensis]
MGIVFKRISEKNNKYDRDFKKLVSKLKEEYLSIWWQTSTDIPNLGKVISNRDKKRNKIKIEAFRKELLKILKEMPNEEEKLKIWSHQVTTLINQLELNIIGYENRTLDFFADKGYSRVTDLFIKEVKAFDSELSTKDMFQAIRNVWITNSIQILFGINVELTPSVFAYSMLYPYSDNYLDDTYIDINNKLKFNEKFRKWLEGAGEKTQNKHENCIYRLVKKIEDEYPRKKYKQVFESLVAIHSAQEKSLNQQKGPTVPYERDIIGITFEKGGASVLADGFLVKGKLTENESKFMFGYGILLQIIDDLQDATIDFENKHTTFFSQSMKLWKLDKLVNKLFWFIDKVLYECNLFSTQDAKKLRDVIRESCIIMIYEAISKNEKMFSKEYIRKIEEYSPVSFSYFKVLKRRFSKSFTLEDTLNICLALSKGIEEKKAFEKALD